MNDGGQLGEIVFCQGSFDLSWEKLGQHSATKHICARNNCHSDDQVLAFGDDTVVTMTRQPAPGKIFQLPSRESPETQRKSLALAMRRFAQSPVVLEAPFYACVYGNGQEDFFSFFSAVLFFVLLLERQKLDWSHFDASVWFR